MFFTDQENENLDYEEEEEDEDDVAGDYNDVIGSSSESFRFPPPLLVRPTPGFNPRLKSDLHYLK